MVFKWALLFIFKLWFQPSVSNYAIFCIVTMTSDTNEV